MEPTEDRATLDRKPTAVRAVKRAPLYGFDLLVTPMTAREAADEILASVGRKQGLVVANINLHGLYMLETDPMFAAYTKGADLCLIDGWPILRLVKGPRVPGYCRIGSTDWLELLLEEGGVTIAALGGTPESSARTSKAFNTRYNVRWIGLHGFDLDEREDEIIGALSVADVVLVGLGMPRQEHWIVAHRNHLSGKVVANVGGCIDYYSGEQTLAPRWMGRYGLEWLYRLCLDPARLADRYLVEPWKLLCHVARRKAATETRRMS